jgi:hypothetical protein
MSVKPLFTKKNAPRIVNRLTDTFPTDARLNIIEKRRSKIADARDRLGQIARTSDARDKLKKIRLIKQGKVIVRFNHVSNFWFSPTNFFYLFQLDVKSTSKGNFTITTKIDGNLELTTKRKQEKHPKKTISPNPRDPKPQSRNDKRVLESKVKPARGRQVTKHQGNDRSERREREVMRLPSSGLNYTSELSGKSPKLTFFSLTSLYNVLIKLFVHFLAMFVNPRTSSSHAQSHRPDSYLIRELIESREREREREREKERERQRERDRLRQDFQQQYQERRTVEALRSYVEGRVMVYSK